RRVAAAYRRAAEICEEDVETNRQIGINGAKLLHAIAARKPAGDRVNILTHCNAGWLACVDRGTALAPIYESWNAGVPLQMAVEETSPRDQGGALSAYELAPHSVADTITVGHGGGDPMQRGLVDI